MLTRRSALAAALGLGLIGPASAQAWPERAITFVVPFAAGGTTDITARILADQMSRSLKQSIVVENTAGAGGSVGANRVKGAKPDGYTFLVGNLGSQAANVGINPNLPYDPLADFEHVALLNTNPMLVVVKNALPTTTFAEFLTYLKANQATMSYGSGGVGATSHLTCLYLHSLVGGGARHVPYRGSGPALNDLMSGQIEYVCDQSTTIVPQAQGGTVKALVVAAPSRLKQLPNVPTAAEAGLPAFQVVGWNGLWAPKGTPADVQERMREAVRGALADEGVRRKFEEVAAEAPDAKLLTAEGLRGFVKSEIDRWVPIVKAAGVTAN